MEKIRIVLFYSLFIFLLLACGKQEMSNTEKNDTKSESCVYSDTALLAVEKTINLGYVEHKRAYIRQFEFELTNIGVEPIIVDTIEVSCDCVKINEHFNCLQPQESGKITGIINLKNQRGHLRKSIFVNYNGGNVMLLKIIANVKD